GGYRLLLRIAKLDVASVDAVEQIESAGLKSLFDHSFRCGNLHLSLRVVQLLARENEDPDAATADIVHVGQVDDDLFRACVHDLFHLLVSLFGGGGREASLHLDEGDSGVLMRGYRQRVSGLLVHWLHSFFLGLIPDNLVHSAAPSSGAALATVGPSYHRYVPVFHWSISWTGRQRFTAH